MPLRSRSHVIEEESKRAFESIIPSEWVIRPQIPDYGLDLQVQIFSSEEATPFFFYVQLKGTDTIKSDNDNPAFSFKTERLRHYTKCPFPVMLVRYDTNTRRLFYEWIHVLNQQLSLDDWRKWQIQKTVTVKFYKQLTGINPIDLEMEVRHQSFHLGLRNEGIDPFNVQLILNMQECIAAKIQENLIRWLSMDSLASFIRFNNDGIQDGKIEVVFGSETVTASYDDQIYQFAIGKNKDQEAVVANVDVILKFTLAFLLSQGGRINKALDLTSRIILEEKSFPDSIDLHVLLPSLSILYAKANRAVEALTIAENLLEKGFIMPAIVISTSVYHRVSVSEFYCQKAKDILIKAFSLVTTKNEKAILHYNLANKLLNESYFREAIEHFHLAANENPTYRDRPYWWSELAGCLFLLGRFRWSENCYRRAIELKENRLPVVALLGDSLLYQGRFIEANQEFGKYLNENKFPIPEYCLKKWLSQVFVDKFGECKRNTKLALELIEDALSVQDNENKIKYLENAIEADPLCCLAWFNIAVWKSNCKSNESSLFWLITSILQNWDIEAWANAVLLLLLDSESRSDLLALAVVESYRIHGAILENKLIEILDLQPDVVKVTPNELVAQLKRFFEECKPFFCLCGPSFVYRITE